MRRFGCYARRWRWVRRIAEACSRHPLADIAVGTFTLWCCSGLILSFLDPFGLSTASDAYSQLIIDRVTAPFYHSPGQDRIAVVLIDDTTLDELGEGWPPPYDVYANLLYRILRQQPKAVFMDILLERLRERDRESFEVAHANLSATVPRFGIPVVLARSTLDADNLFADIPGIETAMVAWTSAEYPLWDTAGRGPSPAPLLYRHLCADAADGSAACAHGFPPAQGAPMAVQWGCAVSKVMQDRNLLPKGKLFVAPTWGERGSRSVELLWRSLLAGIDQDAMDKARERIPYAVTVMAHDLGNPQIRGLLKDRVVLVGAALAGFNDVVETPVNGQLPGVYYHAMALDNLTRYGARYFTNPPQSIPLFLGMAMLMAAMSAIMYHRHKKLGSLYVYVSSLITLGLVLVLYCGFKIAPQNWIGYSLLTLLAKSIQTPDRDTLAPENKERIS
ncbi:CHASE2 domain-containing protein [Desulfovibrio sp. Huiquan2017]|uniref:CHASE2 domain-containing protein n=1 Tax=Desulfovibrio sp. Huiquan2017 TaxID=2816861 RepID=UPI001A9334D0|nr:CHASE2 domain-containing protein [Desulfovibrio sp. Huiquan2017]